MNTEYLITIGLEIHAELKTQSKMWCGCKNAPDSTTPNIHICPVCMAEPGTLPVANLEAIKKVTQVGLALGAEIADFTEFDRKNYFYPDIPKGYQISQYKFPIVSKGHLAGVDITRVHLEEDTAKSMHDQGSFTLIDFNRAGVPLMELVTEACIHSAEAAGKFAKELQLILRTLEVSDANMEMGQMRVEVNFSVSKDPSKLGTKVEVKNLNSFKSVEKAIEYEYKRHTALLDAGRGDEIIQETRGWDEVKQSTFSQRKKENAHDYRYFPDPDLPKLYLHSLFNLDELKNALPELPAERRARLQELGLKEETAEVLVNDIALSHYFDSVTKNSSQESTLLVANYLTSDILGLMNKDQDLDFPNPEYLNELMSMNISGDLSSRGVKDVLPLLLKENRSPREIANEKGIIQKNDPAALEAIVDGIINNNQTQWQEYVAGNDKLLMFFVGQAMKESKGSGNPTLLSQIIVSKK